MSLDDFRTPTNEQTNQFPAVEEGNTQEITPQKTGLASLRKSEPVKKRTISQNQAVNQQRAKAKKPAKPVKRKKKKRLTRQEKELLRKKRFRSLLLTALLLIAILLVSAVIIYFTLSCVNDVLAMNRSSDKVTISISEGTDTDEAIDVLAEKKLIKNAWFCKLFNHLLLTFDEDTEYIPGVYELSPNMGLEVMLSKMSSTSSSAETVMLTFPEGYTADQIIEKLADNDVCSAVALRQTMETVDYSTSFSFVPSVEAGEERYHILEGYLFPDTYDFYIGENCSSVIEKFLANFEKHWTEEYSEKAAALGYTQDEILTIASIIEKEAYGSSQMYQISAVLHNRLKDTTGSFKYLGCDSTSAYINNITDESITEEQLKALADLYDTNTRSGLPVGPICNPGTTAIEAALEPEESDYLYFCHDKNKKIYLASTEAEHNRNYSRALAVNADG